MQLGTRSLTLAVDGIYRTAEVSECRIVAGPLDASEQRLGGPFRQYRLQATVVQDPAAGSMWDLVWSRAFMAATYRRSDAEVEIELRPSGGDVPSEASPWFVGTVVITEPDGDLLGGRADPSSSNRFTFNIDWAFIERPERVTR